MKNLEIYLVFDPRPHNAEEFISLLLKLIIITSFKIYPCICDCSKKSILITLESDNCSFIQFEYYMNNLNSCPLNIINDFYSKINTENIIVHFEFFRNCNNENDFDIN